MHEELPETDRLIDFFARELVDLLIRDCKDEPNEPVTEQVLSDAGELIVDYLANTPLKKQIRMCAQRYLKTLETK